MDDSNEEEDTVQVWRLPEFASRETRAGISRRWTSVRSFTMLLKEYILGTWHALLIFSKTFRKHIYYSTTTQLDDTELIKSVYYCTEISKILRVILMRLSGRCQGGNSIRYRICLKERLLPKISYFSAGISLKK